ncbi:MAG: sigma-70 family RNA polymerase sigma factor [Clostridium sp.]|nr:sigma-70 family RNA polymerase sigma factor [Clostridium sp.]
MGSKQETEVERLLLENYETYYRLAYSYVRQEQDALDIVQEGAYKAIRDCKTVKNPDYLSTWVYRIMINAALDLIRKRKREELSDNLPEAVWEDSYRDMDLSDVLERLDERSRTVVILRYFEDMKLEDIARIVGDNLNTVKARLYRALKKLRLDLEAGAYEASGKERPR